MTTTALGLAPRPAASVDTWISAISTGAILAVASIVLSLTAQALSTPQVYVAPMDWRGEGVLGSRISADNQDPDGVATSETAARPQG